MATPTQQQAYSHHAERAATAAAGSEAVAALIRQSAPWAEILTTFATYQLAAATAAIETMADWLEVDPAVQGRQFAGVSSYGYPISEPIVATIDKVVAAPVEALPPPWWNDDIAFNAAVKLLIASEIADAARSAAQVQMVAQRSPQRYVRVLVPPSCKRCATLAGVLYRDMEAFDRHPGCDCEHVPAASWDEAQDRGLVFTGKEMVQRGMVRDLSKADAQAVLDGADLSQVVNATRGLRAPGITAAQSATIFGRRVKITTDATTKRGRWRKLNPSRPVRLRPEAIYAIANGDRAEAQRLLRLYGYLL